MARCLRCKAGSEWIEGRVQLEPADSKDAGIIARTIEAIDDRAMSADGPVTPTLREATYPELRRIYKAAKRIQKRYIGASVDRTGADK